MWFDLFKPTVVPCQVITSSGKTPIGVVPLFKVVVRAEYELFGAGASGASKFSTRNDDADPLAQVLTSQLTLFCVEIAPHQALLDPR